MPEQANALFSIQKEALSKLTAWFGDAQQLSATELKSSYPRHNFIVGWRIPAEFGEETRRLDVLVPTLFPFKLPRVSLVDRPAFLTWPHVERDGLLCLAAEGTPADHRAYIQQVQDILQDAHNLVATNLAGKNQEDFRHEFHSYWSHEAGTAHIPFLSLISPTGPSRIISVWRGEKLCILGDTDEAVQRWMDNRWEAARRHYDRAGFIWLPQPLLPKEYPKTSKDVFALLQEHAPEAIGSLESIVAEDSKRAVLVIGASSKNGPSLGGLTVPAPTDNSFGKTRPSIPKGFRPGHVPKQLVTERFWLSNSPVTRAEVSRTDAAWIHGRGEDPRQPILGGANVAIVGCGSIGAPVAVQLAMAGVGGLTLLDDDSLKYANVGRHTLGAGKVGAYKAQAVAEKLRADYPHSSVRFVNKRWEQALQDDPELFEGISLIVSMTGDWGSENALNSWRAEEAVKPPIVYGWTEANACAGHAVVISQDACFACGFTNTGKALFQATLWTEQTTRQEPACGAVYQPYGPVELGSTVNLISELVLDTLLSCTQPAEHRIWACRLPVLKAARGTWSEDWLALTSGYPDGGCIRSRTWPKSPECSWCGQSATHAAL